MEDTDNVYLNKKRKLDKVLEFHEKKKLKLDIKILDLPDCVLLEIFRFLDAFELIQLSKACTRFEYLIEDKCLWDDVKLCGDTSENDCDFVVDHLTQRTRMFIYRPEQELLFQMNWLFKLNKLQNITVIILENQRFTKGSNDVVTCALVNFPPSLQVLSLKRSMMSVESGKYFFSHGEDKLTKLHTLLLDFCKWVQESALMVISKLPELRNLSMLGCQLVQDALVYTGLAARYGFKKLQRLNVSYTGLADEFISSFYCLSSLQELYMRNHINNLSIKLSDNSIRWYEHSTPIDPVQPLKQTVYFESPYGPCTCSYGNADAASDEDYDSKNKKQDCEDEKRLPLVSVAPLVHSRCLNQDAGPSASGHDRTNADILFSHLRQRDADDEPVHHCQVVVRADFGLGWDGLRARDILGNNINNHMVILGDPAKKKISLKVLTLRNFYKITDASLQSISHLPLTLLDLTGTAVTDDGAKNFINLHPNCRVIHRSACRCPPNPL